MKMFVGVTDYDWFQTLKRAECDEVNFWKPSGRGQFRALGEGDLFLFKLHSPRDFIVGGGLFLKFSILPASLAWEAFGVANGAKSLSELKRRVYKYRRIEQNSDPDPHIGCIILAESFYLEERDWIPVPANWSSNIVQGKTYDLSDVHGKLLFERVQAALSSHERAQRETGFVLFDSLDHRYGKEQMIRPRVGQGGFKVLITDAYQRRCAITGEKTLPVLEAAHIKPYSEDGPHEIQNGLLLRRDFHTLFDRGYITIGDDLRVEVSQRIKEDFGNGRVYYAHHGQRLVNVPLRAEQLPSKEYLGWHNREVYLG
jgi:putative restriction endonuclease